MKEMIDSLVDRLPYIVVGIAVFLLFFFAAGVVRRLIKNNTEDKNQPTSDASSGESLNGSLSLLVFCSAS